jgi:leucyl aminopeptidase (aminopeptidase T)
MKAEVTLLELPRGASIEEMGAELLRAVESKTHHVICELSEAYFYPTRAWKKAARAGSRVYSLGSMSLDSFLRCVGCVDPSLVRTFGNHLAQRLSRARKIEISAGTEGTVAFQLKPPTFTRRVLSRLGWMDRSRVWAPSGFPSRRGGATFMTGQVAMVGVPSSTTGRWIADAYVWPPREIGAIDEPIELEIESGEVVGIGGCERHAERLSAFLEGQPKAVEHFCLGFNPGASRSRAVVEAERIFGSVTLGFGTYPFHVDAILEAPEVRLDGDVVLQGGRFVDKDLEDLADRLLESYAARLQRLGEEQR